MSGPGLLLLAAGGSSRMGSAKQLLPIGETTLLRHSCEIALATSFRPIVVVLGSAAAACQRQIADLPVTVVINSNWKSGMGSSLALGVTTLEEQVPAASGVLIMLADQPTVPPTLLESLLPVWNPPQRPIAAVLYPEGGGVPALFDRVYFSELCALNGDRGARGLIKRERKRVAWIDPGGELIDIDTPNAYDTYLSSIIRPPNRLSP